MENNIVNSVAVALVVAAATASGSVLAKPEPPPATEVTALQVFDLEVEVAGADSVEAATSDAEAAGFFVFIRRNTGG
jgi:hypothetical protein